MAKARRKRAPKVYTDIIGPTPERLAHGGFEPSFVHHAESGTKTRTIVLTPWHVMMFNRGKLTKTQVGAIARYVDQWDILERSPIKSNLDRTIGSGEGPGIKHMDAVIQMSHWNAAIGQDDARLIVLVACKGLGYKGAAYALHGDSATDHDATRISKFFVKAVDALAAYMA